MHKRLLERRTYGMEDCIALGVIVDMIVVIIEVERDATGVAAR